MKKIIVTLIFTIAFVGQSCRKERSCSCTTIYTEITVIGNNTNTVLLKPIQKLLKTSKR